MRDNSVTGHPVAEGGDAMHTKNPPQPSQTRYGTARPQRQRVSTTELMRGGREVILLHEGQEYVLRITKTGKLILTK
jgi:hemin uptake protein HemP